MLESSILSCFRAGILAVRADGRVEYLNPIGARILEGNPIAVGENIHERAEDNAFYRLLSDALSLNYLPARMEAELPGKDGDRQILGFTLAKLKHNGDNEGICAFFKDLTRVEMAQGNENLKDRLQMLGQMAAGLAHEIRNPIASIGVHCGILRPHLAGNDKLSASVRSIASEVARVESIISECLNFVRPDELGIRDTRVDELVEEVVAKFRVLYPDIRFTVGKQPVDAPISSELDPGLFTRAVTNIVANAAEAGQGTGHIEIELSLTYHFTDVVRFERCRGALLPGQEDGKEREFVRIRIRDDGPGMSRDIQDRIFIPFYTTKKHGTGIGLPLTQKIIQSHGGTIDLKSAPGKGTEFIILIPVRQKHV
ncbi:MAG TPA: ATP-binding protein [Candidatus Deferrimicrobiaceae bacterium]|jgi:signal transduction histidine kinase